jgi:hypothetical protein
MQLPVAVGVVLLLMIGVGAGKAFHHAQQTGKAYRDAKSSLPSQKRAASSSETRGAIWLLALGTIVVLLLLAVVKGAN